MINKKYQRKDRGCESRILGVTEDNRLLIEATWPKDNRNIVIVDREYFQRKYGVTL